MKRCRRIILADLSRLRIRQYNYTAFYEMNSKYDTVQARINVPKFSVQRLVLCMGTYF